MLLIGIVWSSFALNLYVELMSQHTFLLPSASCLVVSRYALFSLQQRKRAYDAFKQKKYKTDLMKMSSKGALIRLLFATDGLSSSAAAAPLSRALTNQACFWHEQQAYLYVGDCTLGYTNLQSVATRAAPMPMTSLFAEVIEPSLESPSSSFS